MKTPKRWLRRLIPAAAALLLALGLEAVQIASQPKRYTGETRTIREAGEVDFSRCEVTGCEVREDRLNTQGEGSVILYDLGEPTELPILRFVNRKHLREDVEITVELAREGEDFREENMLRLTAEKGGSSWETTPPAGAWKTLRVTVDGAMSLRQILWSEGEEELLALKEPMRPGRILLTAVLVWLGLLGWTGLHVGQRIAAGLRAGWNGLTADGRRTAVHAGIFLAAGAAGYALARVLLPGGFGAEMNLPKQCLCGAAGMISACLCTFRKTLGRKPEVLFAVIALTVGGLTVWASPDEMISWDNAYHYKQAVNMSYLGETRLTAQDYRMMDDQLGWAEFFESPEAREKWLADQDTRYRGGAETATAEAPDWKSVWEFFPGVGLYLGRALGLRYFAVFNLGRTAGLITFVLLGFLAIRKLKSGKMILALTLLVPTILYLASVYSYDTGVLGFTALGLAWFFGEGQEPEKRLTRGNALIMLGSLWFGILAKAIYAPLLLLPLFLPKSKFRPAGEPRDGKTLSRKSFFLLDAAALLLLCATFLLPLLFGKTESDTRGGETVDVYGQIRFVLENPLRYAGILLNHFSGCIFGQPSDWVLLDYAYLGKASCRNLFAGLLIAAAFTDKGEADRCLEQRWGSRGMILLILAGTACLTVTSMYLLFTPVGQNSVSGAQDRYLFPLYWPSLMIAGSGWIAGLLWRGTERSRELRREVYNGILFALASFVLLAAMYGNLIGKFAG